jgi:hypothetical protein
MASMVKPGRKPKTLDINQLAAAITEAVAGKPVGRSDKRGQARLLLRFKPVRCK